MGEAIIGFALRAESPVSIFARMCAMKADKHAVDALASVAKRHSLCASIGCHFEAHTSYDDSVVSCEFKRLPKLGNFVVFRPELLAGI
jgi:hypothetical protein